ncbi:HAD-IC family P-type ATPase [Planktothrix sp. FACHB-1355]|uniref:HAD-IC family P-type ATPase n=1 Tax=Aerosakkonema funiforme FACHB-1375 TaxID=2949571 RepID=A0A926ZFP9_9CYAN|nr:MULTISPECIES: HAD-IC family P-type ATPase [Oscillatoriales]MBD2181358.1 HAD-IC family P-type ATPase [Aerosakkonema funiforme FACHB-1375]MBD3557732.1 HAD-IC family P-type ATPase [Planktothrix sp. FACHB-1355]
MTLTATKELQEHQWHNLPEDKVAIILETDLENGLLASEIAERQREFGLNQLTVKEGKPAWLKFILQFNQPLLIILVCAGAIKAILGEWINAGVIWGVTTTNAIISFTQEAQAENAIAALASAVRTEATVIRDGKKLKISSEELVPGDIVLLTSGDKVPADLRLIKVRDLQIDESALTGESVAVEKYEEVEGTVVLPPETPLAERSNMAYAGGFVTFGQGSGIVIATGNNTETGKISQLIEQRVDLTTPLTRKFNQFSQNWLYFVLFMATLTFAVGLGQRNFKEAVEPAVALIVGAIPEGLPAVITVTLAVGVARMARRHAIIRKLPAVETLGSATVICSDKTGTLTENQMTVQAIYAGSAGYTVSGTGYNFKGEILQNQQPIDVKVYPVLQECLLAGLLCNDSHLEQKNGNFVVIGDPTEGALIAAGGKAGLLQQAVERLHPRLDSIPFESDFQYMATLHETRGEKTIYVKGSAEAILKRCQKMVDGKGNVIELNLAPIEKAVETLAKQGLRVLTFAKKNVPNEQKTVNHTDLEEGLIFLGLQGMIDPPRKEAIAAVHACQGAGIQVKMITGDHITTAQAIARRMGFRNRNKKIVAYTGAQLAQMKKNELAEAVEEGVVFARVAPEQKLRIVEALQAKGEIVAMTGDGVNDAPALKQADIGIAMGSGTEVSKEASDMLLTDNNFASIAAAVEEGRSVYKNLLKAICFILPVNGGESMTILISTLLGREMPILSLQILWLNMLNSITMTVPLSFEPKTAGVMKNPPRPANEPFLTQNRIKRILAVSLYNWTLIFGMFEWVRQADWGSIELARTMAIQALVMGRIFYLLSISQLLPSLMAKFNGSQEKVSGAPALAVGIVVAVILQIIFANSTFINGIFQTAPMTLDQWLICFGASLPMIAIAASVNRFDPPN